MSEEEEEAIRKIEKFLDYGEMISVREIAIFYMLFQKEYDKNKELENKLANRIELLDYTISKDYISKDKIKEVIKKYYNDYEEQKSYRYTLDVEEEQSVLKDIEKELLEENKSNENKNKK